MRSQHHNIVAQELSALLRLVDLPLILSFSKVLAQQLTVTLMTTPVAPSPALALQITPLLSAHMAPPENLLHRRTSLISFPCTNQFRPNVFHPSNVFFARLNFCPIVS